MRIDDKIHEIEESLSELDSFVPHSFEDYEKDHKTKAACERYFEKIIESAVDLAFIIIKENRFKTPEEDKGAFDVLAEEEIISIELSEKLKNAKGMRNIITHQYGVVDDELVFHSITYELKRDVKEFVEEVRKA